MSTLRFFAAALGHRTLLFPLITPPLGIMYLGAVARERFGAEVRLINQRLHNVSNEAIVKDALSFEPDIVALSAFTPNLSFLVDVCAKVKLALPDALLIIGGPHVNAVGVKTLHETVADIAVPSEGEVVLEAIMNQYRSVRDWSAIPGIFWRDAHGEIVANPGQIPPVEHLDSLPLPAYDLIDLPAYWSKQSMPPVSYRRYATLMSSRGCPYGCKWCHSIFGRHYRAHSAERIIDEILFYNKTYGVSDFEFQDDIFNMDHKRLMHFCELVHKHNLKIKIAFPNGLRTDILQESEIDALVSVGAYFSALALETGSPRLQQTMGKRLDIGRFLHNTEYAVKKGIFTTGFVMLGFPTETEEELQTTIDVACSSALHTASFFTVMPFPGTEVYEMALKTNGDKIKNYDFTNSGCATSKLNISAVPDEVLWRYQRLANKRFYSLRRLLRILRDTPAPLQLFLYVPHYFNRVLKGVV